MQVLTGGSNSQITSSPRALGSGPLDPCEIQYLGQHTYIHPAKWHFIPGSGSTAECTSMADGQTNHAMVTSSPIASIADAT